MSLCRREGEARLSSLLRCCRPFVRWLESVRCCSRRGSRFPPGASVGLRVPHLQAIGQRPIPPTPPPTSTIRRGFRGTFIAFHPLLEILNTESEAIDRVQGEKCHQGFCTRMLQEEFRRQANPTAPTPARIRPRSRLRQGSPYDAHHQRTGQECATEQQRARQHVSCGRRDERRLAAEHEQHAQPPTGEEQPQTESDRRDDELAPDGASLQAIFAKCGRRAGLCCDCDRNISRSMRSYRCFVDSVPSRPFLAINGGRARADCGRPEETALSCRAFSGRTPRSREQ